MEKAITKKQILPYHPFLGERALLRVGGRLQEAGMPFLNCHPVLLLGSHKITWLDHSRTPASAACRTRLGSASLSRRFSVLGGRAVRSVTRHCVTCRKVAAKPTSQLHGQLPSDRVKPGQVFDRVGIDYAGPVMVKCGPIRKPRFAKGYVAVFVCLATKAVHLEIVSDLTTSAFIATLRRFIGRRGIPSTLWSDHGTNFVGAESTQFAPTR